MNDLQRIKELVATLNKHRDTYYNQNFSEISDVEYDKMYDELVNLEKSTNIILSNSPTQNVGYEVKSELVKVNVVFEGGAGKAVYDLPQILRISNVGSIYTMVVKEYDEVFDKKLRELGASLVEPVDISLEELFVVLEEAKED